ncbi:MAG: hypothetical protein AMXMBFR75_05070 [Candidatus Hinthialibacteria bacterium]
MIQNRLVRRYELKKELLCVTLTYYNNEIDSVSVTLYKLYSIPAIQIEVRFP